MGKLENSGVDLCMACSLDGKIAEAKGRAPNFTSRADREKLFGLRAAADVLLIGANTVRQERLAPLVRDPNALAQRRAAGKPDHPVVALVSASLDLPLESAYFCERQQRILVLTQGTENPRRHALRAAGIEIIDCGTPLSLAVGLRALRTMGLTRILAEGGARLAQGLLQSRLVDRFYLTIAPVVLSGDEAPSLCSGDRLLPRAEFALIECRNLSGELHLIYEPVKHL